VRPLKCRKAGVDEQGVLHGLGVTVKDPGVQGGILVEEDGADSWEQRLCLLQLLILGKRVCTQDDLQLMYAFEGSNHYVVHL